MSDLEQVISEWKDDLRLHDNTSARLKILNKLSQDYLAIRQLVALVTTQCQVMAEQLAQKEHLLSKCQPIAEIEDIQFEEHPDTRCVTTRVLWNDGKITEVTTVSSDQFDPIYGINLVYATRFAGSKSKLRKIYRQYARDEYERQWRD